MQDGIPNGFSPKTPPTHLPAVAIFGINLKVLLVVVSAKLIDA